MLRCDIDYEAMTYPGQQADTRPGLEALKLLFLNARRAREGREQGARPMPYPCAEVPATAAAICPWMRSAAALGSAASRIGRPTTM